MYGDTSTLAAKLSINATTHADNLERVLNAASLEIDHEIGGPIVTPTDEELALLDTVALARAQDLWVIEGLPVGVIGLASETPLLTPRNSWERHANNLAPLKNWDEAGFA